MVLVLLEYEKQYPVVFFFQTNPGNILLLLFLAFHR